jgi:hypothetical protein
MKKKTNIFRTLALAALVVAGAAVPTVRSAAQVDHIGVRTNALTWTMLSPSLGLDVQWGGRWQATADGHLSLIGAKDDLIKMSGAGGELRRYFSKAYHSADNDAASAGQGRAYHGPYIGIGGRYLKYDDRMLHAPSRDGSMITAGITAGYTFSLPGQWTIDTSIGLGYVHNDYSSYEWYAPRQVNRFVSSEICNRFGLTSAEVSLVYHFNLGGK